MVSLNSAVHNIS